MFAILKGIMMGLAVAVPVGPVALLCLNFGLRGGFRTGVVAGMGTAIADALFCAFAIFGLSAISGWLIGNALWFCLLGGAYLAAIGLKMALSPGVVTAEGPSGKGAFATTFMMTWANPVTIIVFGALLGSFECFVSSMNEGLLVVTGVFIGSIVWWMLVASGTSFLRNRLDPRWISLLRRISGILLVALAIAAVIHGFTAS